MTPTPDRAAGLPKRFYKTATPTSVDGGWRIELDGRPLKTPAKQDFVLPSEALAQLIAEEWEGQGDAIDPETMPLTRLVNVALDRTPQAREDLAAEIAKYAETDLVCHLAESPVGLRERQDAGWKPLREWAGKKLDIVLVPVEGIIASPQPQSSLQAAFDHALSRDDLTLTGLTWACGLLGSCVLAYALLEDRVDAGTAFALSRIDEDWQIEHWGEDAEAKDAANARQRDAEALGAFFRALD
ncbi:ATP12 family protein [Henriciella sp. AS95]|uniref:ATP12 family chaperone protein n=1 Tax=Henriciella sp. AS95 TaxID=3135782 RepID=UPI00317A3EF8